MTKSKSTAWPTTRFAGVSRRAALVVLVLWAALTVACLRDSATVPTRTIGATTVPDVTYHRNVVERVRGGQSYHDAAQAELTEIGYPTRSLFNWRLPTYAWVLAVLPNGEWAAWVFRLLALVSVLLAAKALLRDLPPLAVVAGLILLLGGGFAWSVLEEGSSETPEPWCEVLLLVSLSAFAGDRYGIGMVLALAALSVRELALPYCVVAAAWSCYRGRWREILAWAVGFAALGAFLAWHAAQVAQRQHEMSPAAVSSWLHFDGFGFAMLAGTMNVLLQSLPNWLTAVVVPLALLGLAGWRGPLGAQLATTAAIYTAAYLVVRGGEYWGFCNTLLTVLGLVRSPAACRDLLRAIAAAPPLIDARSRHERDDVA